jgi:hypothetical protein
MSEWSSYKKDQLIMESWRGFLHEVETSDFGAFDVSGARTASPDTPTGAEQRNIKLRNIQKLANRVLDSIPDVSDIPDSSPGKKKLVEWYEAERRDISEEYNNQLKFKIKMIDRFDNTLDQIKSYLQPTPTTMDSLLPGGTFPLARPKTPSIIKSLGVYEVSIIQEVFDKGVLGDLADAPVSRSTGPDDTYKNRALKNLAILLSLVENVEIL